MCKYVMAGGNPEPHMAATGPVLAATHRLISDALRGWILESGRQRQVVLERMVDGPRHVASHGVDGSSC